MASCESSDDDGVDAPRLSDLDDDEDRGDEDYEGKRQRLDRANKRKRELRRQRRRSTMTPGVLDKLEDLCHDAAQTDVDYAAARLMVPKESGGAIARNTINRARLYALLKDVLSRRDLRAARTILNILATVWVPNTRSDLLMIEHVYLFLYVRNGGNVGADLSKLAGLRLMSQARYCDVEAARSFLADGDVNRARDALYRYWSYEDEPRGVKLKSHPFVLKSYGHLMRLFILAAYLDLAKKENVDELTRYDISLLLERNVVEDDVRDSARKKKKKKRKENDSDEDDLVVTWKEEVGRPFGDQGVFTISYVEKALSYLILQTFWEWWRWKGAPWKSLVKLALERCQRDPTPSILKLAAKDLLDADTLLAVRDYVNKRYWDTGSDAWAQQEKLDLLHSIDVALNRICPLAPYSYRFEQENVQSAFLDSTWENLTADEVDSSFERIVEHVQFLCSSCASVRKYWRRFWILVEESCPAWLEFGYLPPDDVGAYRSKMTLSQLQIMCLVVGPRKQAVAAWVGEDEKLAAFWKMVRRVEACWVAKEWAKENLELKRAAVLRKLISPEPQK